VKQNKTGFQTLATVFMSRPRRRFGVHLNLAYIAEDRPEEFLFLNYL
jgi:hypothetical protein